MPREVVVSDRAYGDLRRILVRTERAFGERAGRRYERLIERAIKALADEDPSDADVPGLGAGVLARHLSRHRMDESGQIEVKSPRHYLIFRASDNEVEVLNVVHDASDLSRYPES